MFHQSKSPKKISISITNTVITYHIQDLTLNNGDIIYSSENIQNNVTLTNVHYLLTEAFTAAREGKYNLLVMLKAPGKEEAQPYHNLFNISEESMRDSINHLYHRCQNIVATQHIEPRAFCCKIL